MINFTATYRHENELIILRDISVPSSKREINPETIFTLARFAGALIELKYNIPRFIYASNIEISDVVIK